MFRRSSRFLSLVHWQFLCLITAFPLALCGCRSDPPHWPGLQAGQETDFSVLTNPERAVDILFLVDNSPGMDPKQKALADSVPKMIERLQRLEYGLPDVHIGVVDSDVGGGDCPILGDRGFLWGNVPTTTPTCDGTASVRATVAPGSCWASAAGITDGCGLNTGARWIEDIQNANGSGRQPNYTGGLADVFSCLIKTMGSGGCGIESQLQAVRLALNPLAKVNDENIGFVRAKALLAIVLVTDEDDCSNPSDPTENNYMFSSSRRNPGDGASLRCAARGHVCNGQSIPDFDPAIGYTGQGFTANFADCSAKDSTDITDLPLYRVQELIDSVNAVKAKPQEQILVSGIIGWPQNNDLTGVKYQIGKDATLPPPSDTLWSYMPICQVPTITSAYGSIYQAYGGLRLKKFIDAYGDHGKVYSICNPDFTNAMVQIGDTIVQAMKPGCAPYALMDTDLSTSGIQPECQASERTPCDSPGVGDCPASGYTEQALLECKDGQGKPLDPSSLDPTQLLNTQAQIDSVLATVSPDSRPCWYLSYNTDPVVGCPKEFGGQRISVLRKTGAIAPAGTTLEMKCLTCPAGDQTCPAFGQ